MKTKILIIGNGSSIREHKLGDKIDSDFDVVVRFNRGYFEGIKGYEDAEVLQVMSEDAKKVCKKLRLRNYPSIALYINGDKIDTWKGDMDGEIDISIDDIKDAIEDAIAGDQF